MVGAVPGDPNRATVDLPVIDQLPPVRSLGRPPLASSLPRPTTVTSLPAHTSLPTSPLLPPHHEGFRDASSLGEPLYKVNKTTVKSEDHIPDQEWRQLTRTSEHLAEEWRKAGHKAFDDTPGTGPISTTLRMWEMFCYSKWVSPSGVSAVRAFMEAAISAKISDEIKKAFGRQIISSENLRSRVFYDYFYKFAISYLNDNYTDSVYVTTVLQRILNLTQGTVSLSDHLQAAEELIEELKFCASSRVVQLDIDHLSNSLMMSLGEPFRG
ncbi:hypothetical protein Pmar_PMAR000467, partial [Perkinsus marinus ATCC 50983]